MHFSRGIPRSVGNSLLGFSWVGSKFSTRGLEEETIGKEKRGNII